MVAPSNFKVMQLAEVMDLNEAAPLAARLCALRGRPLNLDASHVQRLGGLCLQVLLSARATWATDNVAIGIMNPSAAFEEAMALFGASSLTT